MPTRTSEDQMHLEAKLRSLYAQFLENPITLDDDRLVLKRDDHVAYLYGGLGELPAGAPRSHVNTTSQRRAPY